MTKSIIDSKKIQIILFFLLIFASCEKKKVNQNRSARVSKVSNSKLDQVYNEFMWLEFEKLNNRQLLQRMNKEGYDKAKTMLMLNNVLTGKGIQFLNLDVNILNKDFLELKGILELVQAGKNNPLAVSKSLNILWYETYSSGSRPNIQPFVVPELKDIVFIAFLLENLDQEQRLFSFLNNSFHIERVLDVYYAGKTLDGNLPFSYMLDIQFEIYAKSKLFSSLDLLDSSKFKNFERSIFLKMLKYNNYSLNSFMKKESSDSSILGNLIFLDDKTLHGENINCFNNDFEKWYLNDLRTSTLDICATVSFLKRLDDNYYDQNYNAFDSCECWRDYNHYIILNTLNLMAYKIINIDDKWPVENFKSTDCLESLANEYPNMTGQPVGFSYGLVSPYFMVPYTLLASENGNHWGYFTSYIADQVLTSPFMDRLHEIYTMRRSYSN